MCVCVVIGLESSALFQLKVFYCSLPCKTVPFWENLFCIRLIDFASIIKIVVIGETFKICMIGSLRLPNAKELCLVTPYYLPFYTKTSWCYPLSGLVATLHELEVLSVRNVSYRQ